MLSLVEQAALRGVKACQVQAVFVGSASQGRRHFATKAVQKKNHYHVLSISESATPSEIRAAFVKLSKKLHPDRNPNDPDLHEKFVTLNEAYTVLSKPFSRQEYDRGLAQKEYSRSYTAQEASWKTSQMENHYRNDPAFRAYYKVPSGGYRKVEPNNPTFAAWFIAGLLGLGTLYAYLGFLWTTRNLEETRKQTVENYKTYHDVRELARKRSRDEVLAALSNQRSRTLETTDTVKQKETMS